MLRRLPKQMNKFSYRDYQTENKHKRNKHLISILHETKSDVRFKM